MARSVDSSEYYMVFVRSENYVKVVCGEKFNSKRPEFSSLLYVSEPVEIFFRMPASPVGGWRARTLKRTLAEALAEAHRLVAPFEWEVPLSWPMLLPIYMWRL